MDSFTEDTTPRDFSFPLTPFGAADFRHATGIRLFVIAFIFAAAGSAVMVWAIQRTYVPVIQQCFANANDNSTIASGKFNSGFAVPAQKLGSNNFLEVWAVQSRLTQTPHTAHVRCLLAPDVIRFQSELGYYMEVPYPSGWFIRTDSQHLLSFWATSKTLFPFILGISTTLIILFAWAVLSIIYMFFVAIFSAVMHRYPGLSQSYKMGMCGAIFGGVVWSIAVVLYTLEYMPFLMITAFSAGQVLTAFAFLFLTVFCLPTDASDLLSENTRDSEPFTTTSPDDSSNLFSSSTESNKGRKKSNPFP